MEVEIGVMIAAGDSTRTGAGKQCVILITTVLIVADGVTVLSIAVKERTKQTEVTEVLQPVAWTEAPQSIVAVETSDTEKRVDIQSRLR